MVYIPAYDSLAGHPKTRRMARALDIRENEVIGILMRLWWWAVKYAPDGDLTDYDSHEIADATGWHADPDDLIKALTEAGGRKAGFLEQHQDVILIHDWHEGGGKAPQAVEKAQRGGLLGNHRRWHVARGESDPDCPYCIAPESPPDSGTDIAPESSSDRHGESQVKEIKGEERKSSARTRASQLPDSWQPNDAHRELASKEGVNLDREAANFRDHAHANGRTQRNWDAAFRTWLRKAADFGGKKPSGGLWVGADRGMASG